MHSYSGIFLCAFSQEFFSALFRWGFVFWLFFAVVYSVSFFAGVSSVRSSAGVFFVCSIAKDCFAPNFPSSLSFFPALYRMGSLRAIFRIASLRALFWKGFFRALFRWGFLHWLFRRGFFRTHYRRCINVQSFTEVLCVRSSAWAL